MIEAVEKGSWRIERVDEQAIKLVFEDEHEIWMCNKQFTDLIELLEVAHERL